MRVVLILVFAINLFAKSYELDNCQHYDEFFDKCLFYEKTYVKNSISCTEECQYWDSTFKKCLYKTKCQRVKGGFIQIKCLKFDSFFNRCLLEEKKFLIDENEDVNINININR